MTVPPVQVENVQFGYVRSRPILSNLTFAVNAGRFLAIVGPNGVGKSTLVNLIAGLLSPQAGTIRVKGTPITSYRTRDLAQKIAFVPQETVPVFQFSVAEVVMMARTIHYGAFGFERPADRDRVRHALDLTDTVGFASRPLGSLSAGERQRVFIARALAQDTPILLMDEPTSFLDLKHQVHIYDLLKTIQARQSRAIVAVTHDINLAAQYCDEVLLLEPPSVANAEGTSDAAPLPGATRYRIGAPSQVLTTSLVAQAFGVRGFSGSVGRERFFLPLGKRAKDADRASDPPEPPSPGKKGRPT
jgi:iron complex transport system ATP-binding protein